MPSALLSCLCVVVDRGLGHMSFMQGFKTVVRNKTYMILLGMFLWVWLSAGISQTNSYLYTKYVLSRDGSFEKFLVRSTSLFGGIACYF